MKASLTWYGKPYVDNLFTTKEKVNFKHTIVGLVNENGWKQEVIVEFNDDDPQTEWSDATAWLENSVPYLERKHGVRAEPRIDGHGAQMIIMFLSRAIDRAAKELKRTRSSIPDPRLKQIRRYLEEVLRSPSGSGFKLTNA